MNERIQQTLDKHFDEEVSLAVGVTSAYLLLTISSILFYIEDTSTGVTEFGNLLLSVSIAIAALIVFEFFNEYTIYDREKQNKFFYLTLIWSLIVVNAPPHFVKLSEEYISSTGFPIVGGFVLNIILIGAVVWILFESFEKEDFEKAS